MRLFIAVHFEEETTGQILAVQETLKQSAARGNFTRPENLHLTLVFLGETDKASLKKICALIDRIPSEDITLSIERVGSFPGREGRLYWLGLRQCGRLAEIQKFLSDGLKREGFPIEEREFKPHLTLARECVLRQGERMPAFEPIPARIPGISLMCSERRNGRLVYTELHRNEFSRGFATEKADKNVGKKT